MLVTVMPRWRAVLDEEALRRLGVPRPLVAKTLQAALQGLESEIRFEGKPTGKPASRVVDPANTPDGPP